jgi:hypothetical protein
MGCRTCFLPIFSEAEKMGKAEKVAESPAPTLAKNNVCFFYCGSGNTPFVVCVVTVAWGFMCFALGESKQVISVRANNVLKITYPTCATRS